MSHHIWHRSAVGRHAAYAITLQHGLPSIIASSAHTHTHGARVPPWPGQATSTALTRTPRGSAIRRAHEERHTGQRGTPKPYAHAPCAHAPHTGPGPGHSKPRVPGNLHTPPRALERERASRRQVPGRDRVRSYVQPTCSHSLAYRGVNCMRTQSMLHVAGGKWG